MGTNRRAILRDDEQLEEFLASFDEPRYGPRGWHRRRDRKRVWNPWRTVGRPAALGKRAAKRREEEPEEGPEAPRGYLHCGQCRKVWTNKRTRTMSRGAYATCGNWDCPRCAKRLRKAWFRTAARALLEVGPVYVWQSAGVDNEGIMDRIEKRLGPGPKWVRVVRAPQADSVILATADPSHLAHRQTGKPPLADEVEVLADDDEKLRALAQAMRLPGVYGVSVRYCKRAKEEEEKGSDFSFTGVVPDEVWDEVAEEYGTDSFGHILPPDDMTDEDIREDIKRRRQKWERRQP